MEEPTKNVRLPFLYISSDRTMYDFTFTYINTNENIKNLNFKTIFFQKNIYGYKWELTSIYC